MSEKQYYWLKLEKDFFKQKEIKKLRKVAGGDTLTIIYLKMALLSLENNGFLLFEGIEKDISDELSLELDEEVENIKIVIAFLKCHNMIETKDADFYLNRIPEMTGKETGAAKRMRIHRGKNALGRNIVTEVLQSVTERYTEKEKDLEKDLEKEKDMYTSCIHNVSEKYDCQLVIDYLNQKYNKRYKLTKSYKQHIEARFKEGFTLEDFKLVVDNMIIKWGNDNKMAQYIRPETLFNTKFQSYLNVEITNVDTGKLSSAGEIMRKRLENIKLGGV